jgi:hypothetical protein
MALQVRLPLTPGQAPAPVWPRRCVSCGAAPEAESGMALNRLVPQGGEQQTVTAPLRVPHCARCARLARSIFMAGCVPFLGGGLLFAVAGFALGFWLSLTLGLDAYDDGETWPSLVAGGGAALVLGLVGAWLSELAARVLLLPFFGAALLRAPTWASQLLRESDYVPGLAARLAPDARSIELKFENDAIGREFARLNPGAQPMP